MSVSRPSTVPQVASTRLRQNNEEETSDDGEEEDTMATVTTSFSGGALYSSDHFPEISDYRPSEASKDAGPLLSMLKKEIRPENSR